MSQQSDWIEWNGGECPVEPETLVQVKYRTGLTDPAAMWADEPDAIRARAFRWTSHGHQLDIIAYRVVHP